MKTHSHTQIVRSVQVYTEPHLLSVDDLSEASGLHRDLIDDLEHAGMISSVTKDRRGNPVFGRKAAKECRLIFRLHQRERMSFHLIRQWMSVLNRLEKAERELDKYRRL